MKKQILGGALLMVGLFVGAGSGSQMAVASNGTVSSEKLTLINENVAPEASIVLAGGGGYGYGYGGFKPPYWGYGGYGYGGFKPPYWGYGYGYGFKPPYGGFHGHHGHGHHK